MPALQHVRKQIRDQQERKLSGLEADGQRLAEAKKLAAGGKFSKLRKTGSGDWLMLADLAKQDLNELRDAWQPSWERANQPWNMHENVPLWRCSSAILAVADAHLAGTHLDDAKTKSTNDF
jgi:hypothetical protein